MSPGDHDEIHTWGIHGGRNCDLLLTLSVSSTSRHGWLFGFYSTFKIIENMVMCKFKYNSGNRFRY